MGTSAFGASFGNSLQRRLTRSKRPANDITWQVVDFQRSLAAFQAAALFTEAQG
jgi:hypothetical protein